MLDVSYKEFGGSILDVFKFAIKLFVINARNAVPKFDILDLTMCIEFWV